MSYESLERRKFLRVPYDQKVDVNILKDHKIKSIPDVCSKNMSQSGVLFLAKQQFPIKTLVAMKLDFSLFSDLLEIESRLILQSDYVFGRIVRIEEDPLENHFLLGVSFLCHERILEEDEQELLSLLENKEKS